MSLLNAGSYIFYSLSFSEKGYYGFEGSGTKLLFGEQGMSLKILPSLCTRQVEIGERTGTPGTKYE